MTKQSNEDLIAAHRAGDRGALTQLVRQCEGIVVSEARRVSRDSSAWDDIVQEGRLGLLMAAENYEPERGLRFSTYATTHIRGRQLNYALRNLRQYVVATTKGQKRVLVRAAAALARLDSAGLVADAAAVAHSVGASEEDVREVWTRLQPHADYDKLLDSEQTDACRTWESREVVPDDEVNPLAEVQRAALARFRETISKRRDRYIFDHRLNPETISAHKTQEQVGRRLGLSRERVRQIEQGMIDQLRGMPGVS